MVGWAARGRVCGSSSTRSTTTRRPRARRRHRCSTRSCPATTSGSTRRGAVDTSTCCQNVATENAMGEKIMVDSTVLWAKHYKVDGFRFDLMGHHSRANMLAVRARAGRAHAAPGRGRREGRSTSTARAGTSARWRTTPASTRPPRASSAAPASAPSPTGCATPSAAAGRSTRTRGMQGLGTGLVTDPNGDPINGCDERRPGWRNSTDLIQLGLAGNLRDYAFTQRRTAEPVTGDEVDYNGSAGRLRRPARRGDHLRRRARQRDAVRRADLQAARPAPRWPTGSG